MKKETHKSILKPQRKMWNLSLNEDVWKSGDLETGTSPRMVEHENNDL